MSRGKKLFFTLIIFLILISGSAGFPEQAALAAGFIDFEEGVDGQPIPNTIPGLEFVPTNNDNWIYGDWRTGKYNGPFPSGSMYSNGNFFAWMGGSQGFGRIIITGGCATYLQVGVSSRGILFGDGYDNLNNRIDTDSVGDNLDTGKLARLRVEAPSGKCLAYVILHNVTGEWLIDDLSTDAPSVPSSRPPVILLPGLMGSRLDNDDQCQNKTYEVWPAPLLMLDPFDLHLYHLALAQNGIAPANNCDRIFVNRTHTGSYENGVISSIPVGPFNLIVYGPLIDYLRQYGFDVYPFGYDWRKDLRSSATDLDNYIDDVLSQTGAQKVNIVDHSLGGLLARYYVTSSSLQADKVEQIISLGTPFLGTPKAMRLLRWGDELMSIFGLPLLYPPTVREISQNSPAIYQILPTSRYFDVNGGGYYRLDGSMESLAETRTTFLNGHNSGLFLDAENFHTDQMDYWNIPLSVAYRLIVGTGMENTPGVVHERTIMNLFGQRVYVVDVEPTNGDGTVPLVSAALQGNGFNYSGGVPIWYTEDLDHSELIEEPYVLEFIAALLASPVDINPVGFLGDDRQTASGFPAGETANGLSTPPLPTQMSSQPFPLDGLQISAQGIAELHVYDESGNHIGLNSLGIVEIEIPDSAYETVGDGTFISVPSGQAYTVHIKSSGINYPDLRLRDVKGLTNDLIQRTISYSNIPLGVTGSATLVYQPNVGALSPLLGVDLNGDGKIDQSIPPTGDADALQSKDWFPPSVSVNLVGQISPFGWYTGIVQVTITSTDALSGVAKIEFTWDLGQTVYPYNGPFLVNADLVSSLIIQAVDRVGNKATSMINLGAARIFLPVVINNEGD